jgi:general secretion pathway protein L
VVDPLLRRAEDFGAEVTAVTIDPPERAAWSRINLLPDDRRAPPSTWARWQVIVPAAVLVLLVLAALILPVWQKRDEAIALIGVSEQARHRAEASDALRSELERKVGDYNFALRRKYAFPGTVQVLNDVTRILPDDTWLTQFEFHTSRGKDVARTIALRGESANAGRLVTLLEDSKRYTQAAPRSPTTKIQPGPGEIFDVGAQVEPFAAPAPKPLDLTAPPPVRPRPPTSVTTPTAPTLAPAASAPAKGAAAAKPAAEAAPAGGALAPATAQPRDEPVVAPAAQTAQPGQEPAPPATQPAPQVAPSAPSQFGPLPPTDPNAVIRPRNQR